ncbi:hypothetical protein [Methylibium sp.]|jgi:hypothetical protein|uniref:hypothetical protein n=1 Tax=Methylibium sp. TaxID=2067992 RepID=UPI003D0D36A1
MSETKNTRPRGRPQGTLLALSGRKWLALLGELRDSAGPVNLAATAREYGISRGTLLHYIKAEPGLLEAIQARRAEQGRGYVPVKRGTRATRAAAKARRDEQRALPPVQRPDGVPPPSVMAALQRELDRLDADQAFLSGEDEDGLAYTPPMLNRQLSDAVMNTKPGGYELHKLFGPVRTKKDRKLDGF